MKKYDVKIEMYSGQTFEFETDSDVRTLKPMEINGTRMIVTEEEWAFNIIHIKNMKVTEKV
ncbi:hypothetical protein [Psychrobacillus lasiicapitis]|uniref:Uncharacterized protein n=1 Tax=Psychrobacillus lasiicapitis TaxID=1636719 RepID=A0A544TAJ0_9BACI|nr:hypothetical protein [Psychrobacillus lasiicapitis]TQR14491.1 hypothetical protein FG382_08525 [Psychrobacillus lasiicapitis]GGA30876.1 hypothetical protein GCM10011384_20470 [Psychrobacillus lasiicapitis]